MSKELNGIKDNATVTDKSENLFINDYITNIKTKDTLILKSSLYIPKHLVSKKMLERLQYKFNRIVYPKQCNVNCENYDNRSLENCSRVCNILKIKMLKTKGNYYSIPYFSNKTLEQTGVSKLIKKYKVYDKRNDKKFNIDLQMNITLREYQKKIIDIMKSVGYGQLESPARSGKCLGKNTIINTSNGIQYINELVNTKGYIELKDDIYVTTKKGKELISHTYKEKNCNVYKLVTYMGREIIATPEHPLLVLNKDSLKLEYKEMQKITTNDWVVVSNNTKPLYPSKDKCSKEEAKIYGYMVANGSKNLFSSDDSYVIKNLYSLCKKSKTNINNKFYKNSERVDYKIYKKIKNENATHRNNKYINKFYQKASRYKEIPKEIRESGYSVLKSFLDGYFECDSGKNGDAIELSSASKKLITQIHTILLTHFNITGKLLLKKVKIKTRGLTKYYIISIVGRDANKFCEVFNTSKVCRKFKKYFSNSKDSSQSCVYKKIPFVSNYIVNYINNKTKIVYDRHGKISRYEYKLLGEKEYTRINLKLPYVNYDIKEYITIHSLPKWVEWLNSNYAKKIMEEKIIKKIKKVLTYSYEKVDIIKPLNKKHTVYDITVPNHNFLANGIVSHNTVMFITLLQKLKRKTLILVHTKDIVTQTIDKIYKFTNIKEIEKISNKKYIGNFDDYKSEDYAIIVDTYQKFYNDKNGKKRIKLLNKKYNISTLIIDECHLASAPSFAKVVNNINARYKFGVSATTDRIDGMQYIAKNIIGKVQAKSEDFGMLCNCTAVDSKVSLPNNIRPNSSFFVLQKFFSYSNKRIEVLCEQIKKYVDKGRKILVPVIHIPAMKKIQKTLKDKYDINAELFYAKIKDRDTFLQKANKGEYSVVLGMRKMVTLALDILAWDTIIEYMPLHNIYNYYQEISRVRTPYENKPTPIICTIVDDIAFSYKSFLKQDKVHKKLGFKFTKDYTKILEKYKKADRIKQTKYLRNEDLLPININNNEDDEDFNNVNTKYKENNYRAF